MDEELQIDVVQDDVLGVMFRSDELPVKRKIVLEDGKEASIEMDQTGLTLTIDGDSKTITANELMDFLETLEDKDITMTATDFLESIEEKDNG